MDATYWGHNWGVMLGVDEQTGRVLYMAFIRSETTADYVAAVESIVRRGYDIKGLIVDGKKSLFSVFPTYRIQMCQFHMKQIVRRYLTQNPRLREARALKRLVQTLTVARRADFERDFQDWKEEWHDTLCHRSHLKSGRTQYTHRRLRSAMHSIDFYLPYLFTFQPEECAGMPKYQQQDRGDIHRPEEEPEQPQRHVGGEPQALHLWVFLTSSMRHPRHISSSFMSNNGLMR